jgi:hypothetical protein
MGGPDRAAAALADWRHQGRRTSRVQHIHPGHDSWRSPRRLQDRYRDEVAEAFDVDEMIARFRERATAVRRRGLPPVEGAERQMILRQMQLDFQDFAMLGDAVGTLQDGVLTLRVDLRPGPETGDNKSAG